MEGIRCILWYVRDGAVLLLPSIRATLPFYSCAEARVPRQVDGGALAQFCAVTCTQVPRLSVTKGLG